jgi:hypothetical protein
MTEREFQFLFERGKKGKQHMGLPVHAINQFPMNRGSKFSQSWWRNELLG